MRTFIINHKWVKFLLPAFFYLAIWGWAANQVGQELLLPSPALVGARFMHLVGQSAFWHITLASLFRIMLGFFLGVLSGLGLAILTHCFLLCEVLLSPLIRAIRATPVVSFILLTLVWFSSAAVPVFIVWLMVMPIVWQNMVAGIAAVDRQLLEMAQVFRFGRGQIMRHIYVPAALPFFFSACITSLGLAWKSGIAAEVLAVPVLAIGGKLHDAKVYLETPDLFVWTAVVICLSLFLEKIIKLALRRFGKVAPL